MKKITLLLSIFSFIFSFGQDKTYTMAMDSLLSQVDKSPMATGILYDTCFPTFCLCKYTGYTSFKVRARNGCSWSEWYQYPTFQIKAKPIVYFTVAPNPATETLNVNLENNNIQLPTSASSSMNVSSGISAKLYDSLGNQKASFNLINNAATIDINHLPAGVYYLKILIGNKLESHTVIKQ